MSNHTRREPSSRLLIVDHDESLLSTLTELFRLEGFDVLACETATKAIEYLTDPDIGVAIVDLGLPDGTGTELLEKIHGSNRQIPVIVHPGSGSNESAKGALDLGAFAYVEKVGDPTRLIGPVHRAFREAMNRYADELEATVSTLSARSDELTQSLAAVRREVAERVKSEQSLRTSESRYRDVVENQTELICRRRPNGELTFVNDAYCRYFQRSYDELVGKSFTPSHPPEDRERVAKQFHSLTRDNPIATFEHRVVTSDGSISWLQWTNRALYSSDGALFEYQSVGRDVTDRRRAERSLAESEERFRRAIMDGPLPMMIHAEDGEVIQINRVWTEMTGYTRDDIPTLADWTKFAYGQRQDVIRSRIDQLYTLDGRVHEGEYTPRMRDGRVLVWDFSSSPLGKLPDGRRLVLSVALDVTERKQASIALTERDQQFRLFSQSSGDCFWNWDMVTGAVERSSGFDRAFGYHTKDIQQDIEWWTERLHPEDKERVQTVFGAAVAGKQSATEYEYRFRCQDGSYAVVEDHVCLIRDANGTVVRSLGAMRDITDRKLAEEELKAAHDELEVRVAERTAELSDVNASLRSEIAERKQLEKTFPSLAAVHARQLGASALESMARELASVLGADYTLIGELQQKGGLFIRTLSVVADGKLEANVEYDLAGTPCEHVIANTDCSFPSHVVERFPTDTLLKEMEVEGYVGVPLLGSDGVVIGVVAALFRSPLKNAEFAESVLRIVSARVASEMERSQADVALKRSEKRFKMLADNVPGLFSYVDSQGHFQFVNKRYEDWFDTPPDQLIGRRLRDVVGDAVYRKIHRHVKTVLGGKRVEFEAFLPFARGGSRWVAATYVPDKTSGGVNGFFALVTDISSRKQAEIALRESELWMRNIFDSLEESVLVVTADRDLVSMNAAPERTFGYSANELAKESTEVLHVDHDHYVEFGKRIQAAFDEGVAARFEFEAKRKDGEVFPTKHTVSLLKDDVGEIIGIVSVIRDITERKVSDERLRQSEERLDLAVRGTSDGLWDWNLTTGEEYWSPRFKELLGYAEDELEATHGQFLAFLHSEDRAEVLAAVQGHLEESQPYDLEFRMRTRCGKYRWYQSRGEALRDESGKPYRMVGSMRDITDRKAIEQELRDSEGRVRRILDGIFTFVGLYTIDGVLVEANQAPLDAAGLKREDVIGKPFWETYWWSYSPEVQQQLRDALSRAAGGETVRYDVLVRVAEDRFITIDVMFGPLYDANGKVVQLIGSAVDITERKEAERKHQEAEHRYRTLFDQLPDAVVLIDPETTLPIEFNDLAPRLLGYSREEFATLRMADYDADESPEQVRERVARVLRVGTDKFDTRMRAKDGTCRHIAARVRVAEISGRKVLHSIFRDITERKQAEEELRRLATALEAAGEAAVITDSQGIIEYVNPAFETMYGFTREQALGKTPRLLKSGQHDSSFYEQLWTTITARKIWRSEIINRRADGTLIEVDQTIAPVCSASGELTGYVALARDISERKEAEARARGQEAEMARMSRMSTLGELAAGIAHEINQPLAAIVNFTGAALQRIHAGDTQSEELCHLLQQTADVAERAGKIVHRIRNLVRKVEPCRSTVDINELLREALSLLSSEIRTHEIVLRLELTEDLPLILVDSTQIQQVIVNLAHNAVEALRAFAPGQRHLTLRTLASPDGVEVAVEDTGPGVDPSVAKRLFEPFVTTKSEGLGMGLPISKSIVRAHGGRLWRAKSEGGGAVFRFTLPVK